MSNHTRLFLRIAPVALVCLLISGKAHAGAAATHISLMSADRTGVYSEEADFSNLIGFSTIPATQNMAGVISPQGRGTSSIAESDRTTVVLRPGRKKSSKSSKPPVVPLIAVDPAGDTASEVGQRLAWLIRAGLDPDDDGLEFGEITYTGNLAQAGIFTGGKAAGLTFKSGIMLSTGYAQDAVNGLNYFDIATDRSYLGDLNGAGDDDLYSLNSQTSYDAAILTVEFKPTGDQITFRFRFASEEWPTNWVYASGGYYYYFYDVFGFFVNGVNKAFIPGSETPVGINTIYPEGVQGSPNDPEGSNAAFYLNNTYGGSSSTYGDNPAGVAYNGLTTVLSFTAPVIANEWNIIKIAIGDALDRNFDSAVFIEAHSWRVNHSVTLANPLADRIAYAGKPFHYQVPADTFFDPDPKDALSYTAARPDGSRLPGWLHFDAPTRTFSGTPSSDDVDTVSVMVTATDTAEVSASDIFLVSVYDSPSVTTLAPTDVTGSSATAHGAIIATGGLNATVRGFCWSTRANPTTADSKTMENGDFGTGSFKKSITGLEKERTYHLRAYATNSAGTAYGEDVAFTPKFLPPAATSATTTVPSGAYSAGKRIPLTINFSVPVSSTAGLAITLNSGPSFSTGPLVNQSNYSWIYTVRPGENSPLLNVSSIKGTIVDAHQKTVNPSLIANLSASRAIIIDTVVPTAAISYSSPDPYKFGNVVTLTATFSEAMADTPVVRIAIGGANTVSPTVMTRVDSTHYTYFHKTEAGNGTARVTLSAGTDPAGNGITPVPTSGAGFAVDNRPPTVVLTTATNNPSSQSPAAVRATFSEAVTGFSVADLMVTNGTVHNFRGGGAVYSFDLVSKSEETVSVKVPDDVAGDKAGNGNLASPVLTLSFSGGWKYDDLVPWAYDQAVVTQRNSPLVIRLKASDPNNRPLKYRVVNPPSQGNLSGTGPRLVYTPRKGYTGKDSFTFKVNNGVMDSNIARITIDIQ